MCLKKVNSESSYLSIFKENFKSLFFKLRYSLQITLVLGILGFSGGSEGKASACNVGDLGSISGLGRFPGEGKGYPFQYSGLDNSIDCIVHEVAESDTTERLN